MTQHLRLEQGVRIARAAVRGPVEIRDLGLLESAVRRPQTSIFGEDAYPDVLTKAAALLHSLVGNHALVDGNKRLGWLATYVFCAKNDIVLNPSDDDAYDLVLAVATGELADVEAITAVLRTFVA